MKQLTEWLKQSHMRQITVSVDKKLQNFTATVIEDEGSHGKVICSETAKDPYNAFQAVCVKFASLGPQVWNRKV